MLVKISVKYQLIHERRLSSRDVQTTIVIRYFLHLMPCAPPSLLLYSSVLYSPILLLSPCLVNLASIHPSISLPLSLALALVLSLFISVSLYPRSLLPGPVRFLFLISFIVRYIRRRCLQTSERTPETTADRRQRCHHYEDNALSLSFTMMTSRLSSILRLVCLAIIIICCNRQLLSSSRNP